MLGVSVLPGGEKAFQQAGKVDPLRTVRKGVGRSGGTATSWQFARIYRIFLSVRGT